MIAALILAELVIELGAYAAIVYLLRQDAGVPPAVSAPACALVFVALRLGLVALSCALARSWRDAHTEPLGAAAFLRQVIGETRAFLHLYLLGQLLQPWLAPRAPALVVRGVTPVLFVHGVYCNAGVWRRMQARLQREGFVNLFSLNLGPPLASIDRFAQQLARRVDEVCRACDASNVFVVAHSMGGLAARAWLARLGGRAKVAQLLTIGTPHHGSLLARVAPGACGAQMVPGSAWLARLEADEARAELPLTCILSCHDNLVVPQDSAQLEGARVLALQRPGHFELLLDPAVHQRVAAEIAAARSGSLS